MSENYDPDLEIVPTLQETFDIFKKLFPVYLLLYLGWMVVLSLLRDGLGIEREVELAFGASILLSAFIFVVSSFFTGTIMASAWSYINNQPSHIKNGMRRCADVFINILGSSLLSSVFVIGGLILLIVPGLMIAMALLVVMPVVIIENPGIVNSLKRSHELTDGYKMAILMILLVLIVPFVFIVAVGVAISPEFTIILTPLLQGLATIFSAILYVVIYRRLSA